MTTGANDCVVWNGIHHKTEVYNRSGHGYPAPNFLENVTQECNALGIYDSDDEQEEEEPKEQEEEESSDSDWQVSGRLIDSCCASS